MNRAAGSVADATGNWVDTLAPAWSRPYLRLARLDRPIGSWLLLLPCWWSAALAAIAAASPGPSLVHLALFFVGAFAMRGAGCTWNDIVDRDLDGSVERTRSRPIPSGQVSVLAAFDFPAPAGVRRSRRADLLQPLHHRPRRRLACHRRGLSVHEAHHILAADRAGTGVFLGRTDGLGGRLRRASASAPLLLYAGSIAWVIGYDTIYAHQDREDDALIGIKSTALLFGERTKPMLACSTGLRSLLIGAAGYRAGAGVVFAVRPPRLCRPSGLAGGPTRHRRPGSLPCFVQIRPRRRSHSVCRLAARCGCAKGGLARSARRRRARTEHQSSIRAR